jgi:hypothetical protein
MDSDRVLYSKMLAAKAILTPAQPHSQKNQRMITGYFLQIFTQNQKKIG